MAIGAVCVAIGVGVFIGMLLCSGHVSGGNSDGATVALEGKALAAGNWDLHGWSLSEDSFWSLEAPLYAIGVAVGGISSGLLHVVPSVVALAVVGVSLALATKTEQRRRSPVSLAGAFVVLAVLALPSRVMALFFLEAASHDVTVLVCLGALAAIAPGRLGWRFGVSTALLALGLLGDLQALALGAAPMLLLALVELLRKAPLRTLWPYVASPASAAVIAIAAHEALRHLGGFSVPRTNTLASGHQILRNIAHLPQSLLELLGVTTGQFGAIGLPTADAAAHLIALALILVGPIVCAISWFNRLRTRTAPPPVASDRLDLLLLGGFIASIGIFVLLPIISSDAYARYLLGAVVDGSVLTGRVTVRLLERRPRWRVPTLAGLGLTLGGYAIGFAMTVSGPSVTSPQDNLVAFLQRHDLTSGVGDYWSASITTVDSNGSIVVRPVIDEPGRGVVRYEKQSADEWYGGAVRFIVFQPGAVWNGVDAASATATFGKPARRFLVSGYEVLVFPRPITVSRLGWTGP